MAREDRSKRWADSGSLVLVLIPLLLVCVEGSQAEDWFGEPIVSPASAYLWAPQLADLNGDGVLDMVARITEGSNHDEWHVFLGDGNGNFAIADSIVASEGDWVGDFALIDTNADGHLDLVGYQDGPVGVWHNDGTGQFAFKYYIGGVGPPWAVGDLDGDGYDDLGGCGNDIDVFYGSASP